MSHFGLEFGHHTLASNALLLNSFIPVLIALFGFLFFREKLNKLQAVGLLLSFIGVITIIARGNWAVLTGLSFASGDLIVFFAMVAFAFYTLWLRAVPREINRIGLMAIQIAAAFIFLIPLWLIERALGQYPHWTNSGVLALFYLGIFPSVLAYVMFNLGVAKFGAATAGLCIHLIPVFGAVLALLFLGESLHLYHAIGMIAILSGIKLAIKQTPVIKR